MDNEGEVLITEELEVIQQRALGNNDFYNDSKIREYIEKNGMRYIEDFLTEDILKEYNDLNDDDKTEDYDLNDDDIIEYYDLDNQEIKKLLLLNNGCYKDMVQGLVVYEFDVYSEICNIKGIDIKPSDWDKLFDVTYSYYQDKEIKDYYLDDMLILNRYAFSLALLNDSDVNIDCYLEGLKYMDSSYIGIDDIVTMIDNYNNTNTNDTIKNKQKSKVKRNLSGNKIISFNSYKNR